MNAQQFLSQIQKGTQLTLKVYKEEEGNFEYVKGEVSHLLFPPIEVGETIYFVDVTINGKREELHFIGRDFLEESEEFSYNIYSVNVKNNLGETVSVVGSDLLVEEGCN